MTLKLYLLLFLLFSFQLKSISAERNDIVEQVFTLIYNQQFNDAENVLKAEQNQLDNFHFRILNLDLYWWKYSLSRSKTDAKVLKVILENFNSATQNTQEERINELIRSSYQMRYEIKRYNFIGAYLIRANVRKQIEALELETLHISSEQLNLFDLYLALFQYFDNVINPFSVESKTTELSNSLILLEKYAQEDDLILSTMAHYFLGRVYIKVEKNFEKGQVHFNVLEKQFPENPLFRDIANGTNTKF